MNKEKEGISIISAGEAGSRLARISRDYNLLLYESFLTDMIGHKQKHDLAKKFCDNFDDFLKNLIAGLSENQTLVLSSDHGNFEDLAIATHTYNDAWLLVHGLKASDFADIDTIENVTDRIIQCLLQN